MPFGNKVLQIFMAIHDTINFCLFLNYGMPFFFMCHGVFEVMNSHAYVCVLNNTLLICNYDYNINNRFEKCDT